MVWRHGVTMFGGIEAGGTKFVVGTGTSPADLKSAQFPTTTPEETIARSIAWLREQGEPYAIGVASFGPVDLNPASASYGFITSTPKEHWRNTDLLGPVQRAFGVPVAFDTDVNAAAVAESEWGAARHLSSCLYLTVGTGIGGGLVANGRTLQGLSHPEMGHIRVPRQPGDTFAGVCPYHGDCLEGLASGPAIARRWGVAGAQLARDHAAWRMQAGYLAAALANFICTMSPECIVLGGGVMAQEHLFEPVRREVASLLNGYAKIPPIVPPGLGANSGIAGAIAIAKPGYHTHSNHAMEL